MTHETTAPAPAPASRRALYIGLGLLAVVLSVFALGKLGQLPGLDQAEAWLRNLAGSPWGLPAVVAVFCVAAFLGVPQFALLAASIAVFGPLIGGLYGWIANMLSGALTIVHVRVRNLDGTLGDFRTPSLTASNHIGGARVASESSQLMRLLLRGRSIGGNYFEEAMFRKLKAPAPEGWGLSLRTV